MALIKSFLVPKNIWQGMLWVTTLGYTKKLLPGFQLPFLILGHPFEKAVSAQLSKTGTISQNSLKALSKKLNIRELSMLDELLQTRFNGLSKIDYNTLRLEAQNYIIPFQVSPAIQASHIDEVNYQTYGLWRDPKKGVSLGIDLNVQPKYRWGDLGGYTWDEALQGGIHPRQVSFNVPMSTEFIRHSAHYVNPKGNPISGHTRYYTDDLEPDVFTVLEVQSDAAQKSGTNFKKAIANAEKQLNNPDSTIDDVVYNPETGNFEYDANTLEARSKHIEEMRQKYYQILGTTPQARYFHENSLQRLLGENVKLASSLGMRRMRFPTIETAAKIEGFLPFNYKKLNELALQQNKLNELFEDGNLSYDEYDKLSQEILNERKEIILNTHPTEISAYDAERAPILKKYRDLPSLWEKTFKFLLTPIRDRFGNTWFEGAIPNMDTIEMSLKRGGKLCR